MNSIVGKRILISPLDWGLGHAARCIPIIHNLLENSNEIFVFAPKHLQQYFEQRFSELNFIDDNSSSFSYGLKGFSQIQLIKAALKLRRQIKQEQNICKALCNQLNIDIIISDNRYGFFSPKVKSILITHQLRPIVPKSLGIFKSWVYRFLDSYHHSFNEIWVPDFPEKPGLAGNLSHCAKKIHNLRYLGLLSRFSNRTKPDVTTKPNSILIVASGPESHRREMAQLLSITLHGEVNVVVVGIDNMNTDKNSNIIFKKSPSDEELIDLIIQSEIIISCFGYSTLMDLIALQRSAILVPTIGQTEQEYLAKINTNYMVVARSWSDVAKMLINKNELLEKLSEKQKNSFGIGV